VLTPLTVPGSYTVTLIASNAAGADTLTRPDYFLVSPDGAMLTEQYSEGFEDPNYLYFGGIIRNRGNNQSVFHRTPGAQYTGDACLMLNNFGTTTQGDIDEFITPSYFLDYLGGIQLQFTYSLATACTDPGDNTPALKIYSSIDCGQTWMLRWTRFDSALYTVGYRPGFFIPSQPSDWQTVTLNLPITCAAPNVRFKFEYTAAKDACGNNFYLDDINILGGTVGVDASQGGNNLFSIYPNPSDGNSNIVYTLGEASAVQASLYDVSGRLVRPIFTGEQAPGAYQLPLNSTSDPLAPGTYFVRMTVGDKVSTQKFIVSGQ
jgi:PKD repeat protein